MMVEKNEKVLDKDIRKYVNEMKKSKVKCYSLKGDMKCTIPNFNSDLFLSSILVFILLLIFFGNSNN